MCLSSMQKEFQNMDDLLSELDNLGKSFILKSNNAILQTKKAVDAKRFPYSASFREVGRDLIPQLESSSFSSNSSFSTQTTNESSVNSSPSDSFSCPSPRSSVYKVQFKRAFRYFTANLFMRGPINVYAVGDFVIVDMERSEDLGVVVDIIHHDAYIALRKDELIFETDESKMDDLGYIARMASRTDREHLAVKFQDEQNLLEYCQTLLKQVYILPIKIIGVEFQFDRTKLSVYYTASKRVDFRELVKTIFARCKVRVWMIKVNRNDIFIPVKFAELALSTGMAAIRM